MKNKLLILHDPHTLQVAVTICGHTSSTIELNSFGVYI
jgi:hypothetical protein